MLGLRLRAWLLTSDNERTQSVKCQADNLRSGRCDNVLTLECRLSPASQHVDVEYM